ncbi:MAG: S8 family serine peptidase [Candidatus Margulisbacteria bacterium]|nr:S8 family serine peptidase [Candidatus Margulisiibacteriota bacterium]
MQRRGGSCQKIFVIPLLFFLFLCLAAQAETIPGQLIVKFKPGVVKIPKGLTVAAAKAASVSAASVKALGDKYQVVKYRQLYRAALNVRPDWTQLEDIYVVEFPKEKNITTAKADFKKDQNVIDAQADLVVRAFDTIPNDTLLSQQWALTKIKAEKGWDKTTGDANIEIAVLDTGLNYNHEDFSGKVDTTNMYDIVNDDNDPIDDYGHGTAVAGVAGAIGNNSKGIAGLDWKVKILPIKVLNNEGKGSISNVSAGIEYVTALKSTGVNIAVINLSLGQYIADSVLETRCQEAHDAGILVVASAGNENVEAPTYPACYASVLAVAATDQNDQRAIWSAGSASNYGTWVDVAAPGSAITTTDMDGGYSNWDGTSFASPYVAGLASLIKAANPAMTNVQLTNQITSSADSIDSLNPGYEGKLGSGRINAYEALGAILASLSSPTNGEYVRGTKQITGTAGGWDFNSYQVDLLKNGSVEANIISSSTSVDNGTLANWDTTSSDGAYTVRLRVVGTNVSTTDVSVEVVVDNSIPTAEISSPADGATASGAITIVGNAEDVYFDHYVLEYGAGSAPSNYLAISPPGRTVATGEYYSAVANGALGTWETVGLSGPYTLRLIVYSKAGNIKTKTIGLNLSNSGQPTKEIKAMGTLPGTFALPNPLTGEAGNRSTSFVYDLEGNFNTTIYLFDTNGSLVWRNVYLAGENGGKTGVNNPAWDGKNLFGENVPNGTYLYQVTADQKVIGRGKVIVLN